MKNKTAQEIYEKAKAKARNSSEWVQSYDLNYLLIDLSDLQEICLSQEPEEEKIPDCHCTYCEIKREQEPPVQDKGIDERAKQNYETKPVKVEAIQWTGTNTDTIEEWLKDYGCWLKKYVENGILAEDEMMLGVHLITHSNWVVRIRGDFIIESDEQFKNKYQRKVQEVSASQLIEEAKRWNVEKVVDYQNQLRPRGAKESSQLIQHLEDYLKSQAQSVEPSLLEPLTIEQAEKAYDEAPEIPLSKEFIDDIVKKVTSKAQSVEAEINKSVGTVWVAYLEEGYGGGYEVFGTKEEAEDFQKDADSSGDYIHIVESAIMSKEYYQSLPDQPQQPTARELLEALREHWLKNTLISSADDILTYAEQWLKTKEQEKK